MTTLRDGAAFAFEQVMTSVAWTGRSAPSGFDVVYNLLSVSLNQRARIIVTTTRRCRPLGLHDLAVATWWSASAGTCLGIVFSGQARPAPHPDRLRLRGASAAQGLPADRYVEVRYDEDRKQVVYEKVRLPQDFRNFDFMSPWEAMPFCRHAVARWLTPRAPVVAGQRGHRLPRLMKSKLRKSCGRRTFS